MQHSKQNLNVFNKMLITIYDFHLKKKNHSTEEREKLIDVALSFLSYIQLKRIKTHQINNKMIKSYFTSFRLVQISDSEKFFINSQKDFLRLFLLFLSEKIKIRFDKLDINRL